MRTEAFPMPRVVRSVVLESYERLKKDYRDAVTGELLDKELTLAILEDLIKKSEDDEGVAKIIRLGRHESWPYAIYHTIRERIRTSTGVFETHTRAQQGKIRQPKSRQRLDVTFRDATGARVTKDRRFLRKDELPLVWVEYERRGVANLDIAKWCHEVWDQMELRGFGDAALVGEVVKLAGDADNAVSA